MSQISPPMRILLVGSVLFLAAWLTVLKPGGGNDATPAATSPATPAVQDPNASTSTPLGSAVQSANGASSAQTAANAAHGDETQAAAGTTAAPAGQAVAAGAPSADVSSLGLPKKVAKAVADQKILVMLFWNPKAADDRAVKREMRNVGSRHKRTVAVHTANVNNIARYAALVPKASVQQSPSVVVVGHDRQATVLSGYSDQMAIEQVVSDALRART
jgi:hypothetical protein